MPASTQAIPRRYRHHTSVLRQAPRTRRRSLLRLVTCLSCEQEKEEDQLFRHETRLCRSIPADFTAKPRTARVRHITHGTPALPATRTCSVPRPLPSRAARKPAAFASHGVKLPTLIHRFCFRWPHHERLACIARRGTARDRLGARSEIFRRPDAFLAHGCDGGRDHPQLCADGAGA